MLSLIKICKILNFCGRFDGRTYSVDEFCCDAVNCFVCAGSFFPDPDDDALRKPETDFSCEVRGKLRCGKFAVTDDLIEVTHFEC